MSSDSPNTMMNSTSLTCTSSNTARTATGSTAAIRLPNRRKSSSSMFRSPGRRVGRCGRARGAASQAGEPGVGAASQAGEPWWRGAASQAGEPGAGGQPALLPGGSVHHPPALPGRSRDCTVGSGPPGCVFQDLISATALPACRACLWPRASGCWAAVPRRPPGDPSSEAHPGLGPHLRAWSPAAAQQGPTAALQAAGPRLWVSPGRCSAP